MSSFFREFQKALAEVLEEFFPSNDINYKLEDEPDTPDPESIELTEREIREINNFAESLKWEYEIFGDNEFEEEDEKLLEAKQ